jgi:hypothetical protein
MARTKITLLLLGVLAIVFGGCQSKSPFASVEGIVTQDGKPLAGVIVNFYPDPVERGPRSTSDLTDESGHYRLHSTGDGGDGAVVGPHRVCITEVRIQRSKLLGRRTKKAANNKKIQEEVVKRLKVERSSSPRVPSSYDSPNETPLSVEVHPGPQVIDLVVK